MKKYFVLLCLIILILSGCNGKLSSKNDLTEIEKNNIESDIINNSDIDITNNKTLSWLENYSGNWRINDLFAYFSYSDPTNLDYVGTKLNVDDENIGLEFKIDTKNNKFVFNNDDTFKIIAASEVDSEELSESLFAPNWSVLADNMARIICGGVYVEGDDKYFGSYSEGILVKCMTFENKPNFPSSYSAIISIIISANGELLLNVSEGGGTYKLVYEKDLDPN